MHKQLLGQVYNFNGFNAPQLCSLVVVVEGGQETSKGMQSRIEPRDTGRSIEINHVVPRLHLLTT